MWWGVTVLLVTAAAQPNGLEPGIIAFRAGRYEAAAECFQRVLTDAPDCLPARYWQGLTHQRRGRDDLAIVSFRAVVRQKPSSRPTWWHLAAAYERLGSFELARQAYRQVLRLAPSHDLATAALERLVGSELPLVAPRSETWVDAPAAPIGSRVAVSVEGLPRPFEWLTWTHRLDCDGARLLDYTFGQAPTDWEPTAGEWAVTNRYACDPSWSFYGGWSPGTAILWNKRSFTGDLVMEAYVAFKFGLRYTETRWLERPSDACLTLCGDGRDPSSGYSFIFAGENGTTTLLKKGDVTLARTQDPRCLPPSFSDQRPSRPEFHWKWWRLEAARLGQRLRFSVNGHEAFEVTDPEPLSGRRVALWTVHNGLLIARVRIAYAAQETFEQPLVTSDQPVPPPAWE